MTKLLESTAGRQVRMLSEFIAPGSPRKKLKTPLSSLDLQERCP